MTMNQSIVETKHRQKSGHFLIEDERVWFSVSKENSERLKRVVQEVRSKLGIPDAKSDKPNTL